MKSCGSIFGQAGALFGIWAGLLVWMAGAVSLSAADAMKTYTVEVCGATVSVDLHPNVEELAVLPKNLTDERLREPGSRSSFLSVMYDYRRRLQMAPDGRVSVSAEVDSRAAKRREEGISHFDLDRMIASYNTPGFRYEKVQRGADVWIKRTKIKEVPPGQGRSVEMEWLVPLSADLILIFRTKLSDNATPASQKDAKWYNDAEAMQQRIFESLKVELKSKPSAGK